MNYGVGVEYRKILILLGRLLKCHSDEVPRNHGIGMGYHKIPILLGRLLKCRSDEVLKDPGIGIIYQQIPILLGRPSRAIPRNLGIGMGYHGILTSPGRP